ncbi:hypothetical protein STEG23_007879, partial [Scotinomys teguina]
SQKKPNDPLELELQMVVSCCVNAEINSGPVEEQQVYGSFDCTHVCAPYAFLVQHRGKRMTSAFLELELKMAVSLYVGAGTVTGTVGESLSVQCQYEKEYKTNDKYWCRVSLLPQCKEIVKTRASKEDKTGRVSIRDHPANLTFTVTLENLTLEDAGTYKCVVDIPASIGINFSLGIDDSFKIMVSVVSGSSTEDRVNTLASPTSSPVHTQASMTTEDTTPGPSLQS